MNSKLSLFMLVGLLFASSVVQATGFSIISDLDAPVEINFFNCNELEDVKEFTTTLAAEDEVNLDNDFNFWRVEFEYAGIKYSIVYSQDQFKAGGWARGRKVFVYGSLNGSCKNDTPGVNHFIKLSGDGRVVVDLSVE